METTAPHYYVEEYPGVVGAALMRSPWNGCAVAIQLGSFHRDRASAQAAADRINAVYASQVPA